MISAIQKQANGTIQLTITIPSLEVKKAWEEVLAETQKETTIPGFRKGKAPRKLVEERIDTEKVKEEVLKKVLPKFYVDAIKEHQVKPIVNPKIHIDPDSIGVEKLEEGKDWQFVALTCEAPVVELGSYKDVIKKVTAKSKIVIPGKTPEVPKFDEVVKALLESTTVSIPQLLLDNEVERLLAQSLDEIKKLGLTLDQYLASTGRNPQILRAEYTKRAQNDLKLEFALQKIAEAERITVEEKEIEEAIQKAKSDEEKKHLESNRYLLANILRQQKTLDFLRNL